MLKKKIKITTKAVSVAIISLLLITMHNQPPKEPLIPDTSPVSASLELGRDNTPPTENKAVVADAPPKSALKTRLRTPPPTETDFKPPNKADSKAVLTESSTARDDPTPTPAP